MTRITIKLNLLAFAFVAFFIAPGFSPTVSYSKSSIPDFPAFYNPIQSGEADVLRGVYVSDTLAFPVVQQPADDPYYVSNHDGEVTQFDTATQYGNIGLLAHNNLSGRSFSRLSVGQEVELVYGDGRIEKFVITEVLHFQALQPQSQQSTFLNLDNSETLSANQMFNRVYTGSHHLTFQTCIKANGNMSWGRLFVVATPKVQ
ncbi:MAG TPA: hypothetical protein VF918_08035 [Anaerolineales bacterium]